MDGIHAQNHKILDRKCFNPQSYQIVASLAPALPASSILAEFV